MFIIEREKKKLSKKNINIIKIINYNVKKQQNRGRKRDDGMNNKNK